MITNNTPLKVDGAFQAKTYFTVFFPDGSDLICGPGMRLYLLSDRLEAPFNGANSTFYRVRLGDFEGCVWERNFRDGTLKLLDGELQ